MNTNQNLVSKDDWKHEKDFSDPESGVTVRINKMMRPPKYEGQPETPFFSFEIIRLREGNKVSRFFPIVCDAPNGEVSVDSFPIGKLAALIDAAEGYCQEVRQEREDKLKAMRGKK